MNIEVITDDHPHHHTDLGLEVSTVGWVPEGVTYNHPLMLDVRSPDGELLYRLHISYAEVDNLSSALQKLKNRTNDQSRVQR